VLTQLPFPECIAPTEIPKPTHAFAYWAKKTAAFHFTKEDNLRDPETFNRISWEGLKGNLSYPSETGGTDLRKPRRQIVKKARLERLSEDSKIEDKNEVTRRR